MHSKKENAIGSSGVVSPEVETDLLGFTERFLPKDARKNPELLQFLKEHGTRVVVRVPENFHFRHDFSTLNRNELTARQEFLLKLTGILCTTAIVITILLLVYLRY